MLNELVHVWDIDNGERFETYVLEGERGAGQIIVNGAAAHRVRVGHKLIIAAFCLTDEPLTPKMILVDDHNHYVRDLIGIRGQGFRDSGVRETATLICT